MGSRSAAPTGLRITVCKCTPSRTGIMTCCSVKTGAEADAGGVCCAREASSENNKNRARARGRIDFLPAIFRMILDSAAFTAREYSNVYSANGKSERNGMNTFAGLEYFFLSAQVAKRADIGDRERHAELIFRAHLTERDATIFERQSTATSVIGDLRYLVLQCTVLNVVADAAGEIKSF